MALTVTIPITAQRMVQPLGPKRRIIGDQQQHGFFEPVLVIPASPGKTLPVFQERLGVVVALGSAARLLAAVLFEVTSHSGLHHV